MATFDTQIQALAGTATQTEMDDWATDAVKEIINILPPELKMECSTITNLYIGNTDTVMDLDVTGEISHVTRENANSGYFAPCRKIHPMHAGLTSDSSSLHYATVTDPVYWIESDSGGDPKLHVYPTATALQPAKVYHITYPTVDVSAVSAIVNFPNEAEYLVVLYAAVKVLQNKMNEMNSVTAIDTDAFAAIKASVLNAEDEIEDAEKMTANIVLGVAEVLESAADTDTTSSEIKTAADAIATALSKFRADASDPALFGDETQYTTGVGMTRVENALNKAQALIDEASMEGDTEPQSAQYWLNDEDTEMVQATLQTAQTEIQRAQIHISEWNATVQTLSAEAQGFANEIQARGAWTSAKAQVWNGYFASAQAYASAAQTYLASAQGYIGEAKIRMERESQKYGWYQAQQLKLQQDYDKGIQMLVSGGIPKPAREERRR